MGKTPEKRGYLVREFARLTRTTVRTLHHYDRIGLLKPSFARPNGYRVYTDDDLLKLQQIMTLKFMGFSLARIRSLLQSPGYEAAKALRVQAAVLREEIERLRQAARAVDQVLKSIETRGTLPRQKLLKIMEVIQMSEDVKKAWYERFYTEEELAEFRELGKAYTPEMMADYQRRWQELIDEVKRHLHLDPASPEAQDLGRRWTALFDEVYGGHPGLKAKIAQAYTSGAVPQEHNMISAEVWDFIKKVYAAAPKK